MSRARSRMTAMLGEPYLRGAQHVWQVPVDLCTVNVVRDLPDPLEYLQLWILDPGKVASSA